MYKVLNSIIQVVYLIALFSMVKEQVFNDVYIISSVIIIVMSFIFVLINFNFLTITLNQMYLFIADYDKKSIIIKNLRNVIKNCVLISFLTQSLILIYFFQLEGFLLSVLILLFEVFSLILFCYLANFVYNDVFKVIEVYISFFVILLIIIFELLSFDFFINYSLYLMILTFIILIFYLALNFKNRKLIINKDRFNEVEDYDSEIF